MQLSTRQQRLGTETAFETLAKAKKLEAQGKDIVHLEIGEPDFDSPDHVIQAAKKALDDGFTHYGPSAGQQELREAIAIHQGEFNGYSISPERVIVTPGGKPVMFFSILALIERGDEVIYPNPGFPIYESMIKPTNDPIINDVLKLHIKRHKQGMKQFKKTISSTLQSLKLLIVGIGSPIA